MIDAFEMWTYREMYGIKELELTTCQRTKYYVASFLSTVKAERVLNS